MNGQKSVFQDGSKSLVVARQVKSMHMQFQLSKCRIGMDCLEEPLLLSIRETFFFIQKLSPLSPMHQCSAHPLSPWLLHLLLWSLIYSSNLLFCLFLLWVHHPSTFPSCQVSWHPQPSSLLLSPTAHSWTTHPWAFSSASPLLTGLMAKAVTGASI